MSGLERDLVVALERLAARAREDHRAGRISLAERRRIVRLVRETIGR